MPHISLHGLSFYYEQAGQGRDVLVLNGSGSDMRVTPNIMQSPLTSHFRVTSFDPRGLGQSAKPEDGYTMAAYADDAAALLEALGLQSAMVLGISFGGMVGQELAIRHPACVSRAALFCTAAGGQGGASYPLHELADLPEYERLALSLKLNDTRIDDAYIKANPDALETARQRIDLSAYAHEPNWAHGRAGQLAARAAHDCWERLPQIDCPIWLAGGKYDGIATPQAMQNMASQIPHAKLDFYEGGHLFIVQDGKTFPDLISFFNQGTA
jgi:3-oxoadipate enol-lactonase